MFDEDKMTIDERSKYLRMIKKQYIKANKTEAGVSTGRNGSHHGTPPCMVLVDLSISLCMRKEYERIGSTSKAI